MLGEIAMVVGMEGKPGGMNECFLWFLTPLNQIPSSREL